MATCYYFHNLTKNDPNNQIIPDYDSISVPRLNWNSDNEINKIFLDIINLNNWDINDHIRAAPDDFNSSAIEYKDGYIEYIPFEEHLESINAPPDDMDAYESDEDY